MSSQWKLVPKVATLEMKNSGWRECDRQNIDPESIEMQTIWTAMLLESPTPPQPIYDEAKDRELFEAWALEEIGPYFNKHEDCLVRTDHGGYLYGQTVTSWQAWLACAQSRAKAVEADHE